MPQRLKYPVGGLLRLRFPQRGTSFRMATAVVVLALSVLSLRCPKRLKSVTGGQLGSFPSGREVLRMATAVAALAFLMFATPPQKGPFCFLGGLFRLRVLVRTVLQC